MAEVRARPEWGVRWALLPFAVVLGLAAERAGGPADDPLLWVPDLLVGVLLAAGALVAVPRQRPTATLLGLASGSWFLGTVWAPALFLHVGPLVHLLVTSPGWRPRGRTAVVGVVGAYTAAAAMPQLGSDLMVVVLAVGMTAILGYQWRSAGDATGRHRRAALAAGVVLATTMLTGALLRTAVPEWGGVLPALLLHEAAVCVVAAVMVSTVRRPAAARVTDLVIDFGGRHTGTLQDALARTLGDPALRLGRVTPDGRYLDVTGAPLALPEAGSGRRGTVLERDGQPFAAIVHDPGALDDPGLLDAVATALRLAEAHAALVDAVDAQAEALRTSHRRLLRADDDARARLDHRLRSGAQRGLAELSDLVGTAAAGFPRGTPGLTGIEQELVHTQEELTALARGLRPPALDGGLAGALGAAAARCPVPVDIEVTDDPVPADVGTTAWFVCAEALANAVRHSGAGRVRLRVVRRENALVVDVQDDGGGGADPAHGTGLRGLADRVHGVGGRLRIADAAGGGTRVTAELPLAGG